MGFNDEYMKLRKKRLGEAEKEADKKAENKTFTDTYNELRNERLASEPSDKEYGNQLLAIKARGVLGDHYDDDSWKTALSQLSAQRDPFHKAMEAKYGTLEERKRREEENTWFSAGAFDDGYDFGDITRSLLATGTELVDNVATGVAGIGEGVVDAGAWVAGGVGGLFGADEFQDDMQEFIAGDLYDESAVGEAVGWLNPLKWGNEILNGGDADANSILGEKAEGLVQSAGQLAATAGLQMVGVPWWLTTGVTSFGAEAENAFNQGATYGEAGLSAAISAGAEILTEKLFGGSGLKEKGMFNLDGLTKGIADKAVKALADFGVDMAAEGVEEVVSEFINNLGSALYKEEDLGTILASEEALEGYLDAFIGGAILSGTMNVGKVTNSVKKGQDYRTGDRKSVV